MNPMTEKGRITTLLNREWKFVHGNVQGAEKDDFDASGWYDVGIPHSFEIPYFGDREFYVGYGWYRKTLLVPSEWKEKAIFLEFDGVFQHAEIFINGIFVSEHKGGYTGFYTNIAEFVHSGVNSLAIRVNNLWDPELAPRAGEHVFCGGIYRDVRLVAVDRLHVAWYGTFITTPAISTESAHVKVQTEIENGYPDDVRCKLVTTLRNKDRMTVAAMEAEVLLAAGEVKIAEQWFHNISNPELWSPETPGLYTAETKLLLDNIVVDTYETPFGFRWMKFTADRGFFLNGEHYYIKGANVHQDHAGWGDAVTHAGIYRDVKMIKDCGMNAIRGSHYPHHPVFAKECDEQGILFWSELCYWGIGGFKEDGYWDSSAYPVNPEHWKGFEESCIQTLKDMIRINRNHPSIITWSMGNEVFFTAPEVMERAKALTVKLVEISHNEDPGRPASVGGTQRNGFDILGDVAGYNGDGAVLYMDPHIPNLVAEYGSVVADRPGEFYPGFGMCQNIEYSWRSGQILWCGFHHGSIAGDMGKMGMIDYHRLPLKTWYWYRKEYLGIEPPEWPKAEKGIRLHLEADRTIISNDGTEDSHIIVSVLGKDEKRVSDSPDVTLTIMEGPGSFPTGSTILLSKAAFSVLDGMGAIEFRSYYSGQTRIVAEADGLKPAEICITTKGTEYLADRILVYPVPPPKTSKGTEPGLYTDIAGRRPVIASSEDREHPRNCGNDGLDDTWWCAEMNNEPAWWQVDLENFYYVGNIKVTLLSEGKYRYKIEISVDGKKWDMVVDHRFTDAADKVREDRANGIYGRFLRITYTEVPEDLRAGHYNIEVQGTTRLTAFKL